MTEISDKITQILDFIGNYDIIYRCLHYQSESKYIMSDINSELSIKTSNNIVILCLEHLELNNFKLSQF